MESHYDERKIIHAIKDILIKGRLADANRVTRFTTRYRKRVVYIIPTRNKAVTVLLSSPIKDDAIDPVESNQVITVVKIFSGKKMLVRTLEFIRVGFSSYRKDLIKLLEVELTNVFDIDFKGWKEYDELSSGLQQTIRNAIQYGKPIPTAKEVEDCKKAVEEKNSSEELEKVRTFSVRNGRPSGSSLTLERVRSKKYRTILQKLWCEELTSLQRAQWAKGKRRNKYFSIETDWEALNVMRLRWQFGKPISDIVKEYGFSREDVVGVLKGDIFWHVLTKHGREMKANAKLKSPNSVEKSQGLVLSEVYVRQILHLRLIAKLPLKKIGSQFGVSGETVRQITTGVTWTRVYRDFIGSINH
jgi:hypothetical protein